MTVGGHICHAILTNPICDQDNLRPTMPKAKLAGGYGTVRSSCIPLMFLFLFYYYSWIDCDIDIGRRPAFWLSMPDFRSVTSFGFLIKNYTGYVFGFFVKPQNGLVWRVFAFHFFVCVYQRVLGQTVDLGPLIGSLYHTGYRTRITWVKLVRTYKCSIISQISLFRTT